VEMVWFMHQGEDDEARWPRNAGVLQLGVGDRGEVEEERRGGHGWQRVGRKLRTVLDAVGTPKNQDYRRGQVSAGFWRQWRDGSLSGGAPR